jgi:hypothetical protein
MRGGIATVRTTLMLARQQAVTKRRTVTVQFVPSSTTNLMRILETTIDGSNIPAHADAYLPVGIEYEESPADIVFYSSGRANGVERAYVKIRERVRQRDGYRQYATVTVWPLTGVTRVEEQTKQQ